jgi:uncharacterized protein YndB with AHSA1/START domain
MTDTLEADVFGDALDAATLRLQRRLPGPMERVWRYLTESDLRRQWLASGDTPDRAGEPLALTWRNDELTQPPGRRPDGMNGGEHTMQSRVIAIDPPRSLTIAWGQHGEVQFDLEPAGGEVILTLTHRRVPDRGVMLSVSSGWHAHLDILAARLNGRAPAPFWDEINRLRPLYEARLPG